MSTTRKTASKSQAVPASSRGKTADPAKYALFAQWAEKEFGFKLDPVAGPVRRPAVQALPGVGDEQEVQRREGCIKRQGQGDPHPHDQAGSEGCCKEDHRQEGDPGEGHEDHPDPEDRSMAELWEQLQAALAEWEGQEQPPTDSQRIAALETVARIDRLAGSLFELRLRVERELRDADRPPVIGLPDTGEPYDPRD